MVKQHVGKQSLDVGADRIARTAHAALNLLEDIRMQTAIELPLAWEPNLKGAEAIEVYPAATLRVHGIPDTKYKKPGDVEQRSEIVRRLETRLEINVDLLPALKANADVLDAAVCILAGIDFLSGRALAPENKALAQVEGWIWVAG